MIQMTVRSMLTDDYFYFGIDLGNGLEKDVELPLVLSFLEFLY